MPCAALKITIFDVTMKPFCIILLIILTSSNSFAQDYNLSLGAEYSENFAFRNYSGQLLFELPVGDNFTLNINFSSEEILTGHFTFMRQSVLQVEQC
jgi:hypothetical protein